MDHEKKENEAGVRMTRKTAYIAIAVVLVAGLGIAGAFLGLFDGITGMDEDVVATVNGEVVTEEEFNQAMEQEKMQYQAQGVDLESEEMAEMLADLEEQVLDNYFIIPILLEQKAEEQGIEISDEEIEERYQEYAAQFGGEEQLLEAMEDAGLNREDLDEDIIRELTIQNYLDQYLETYLEENPDERIEADKVELSDEEVEEYYQQMRSQYDEIKEVVEAEDPEVPAEQQEMMEMQFAQIEEQYGDIMEADDFEEVKPQLEEEMREERVAQEKQEKEQRILMAHIEELREESDVEKNL